MIGEEKVTIAAAEGKLAKLLQVGSYATARSTCVDPQIANLFASGKLLFLLLVGGGRCCSNVQFKIFSIMNSDGGGTLLLLLLLSRAVLGDQVRSDQVAACGMWSLSSCMHQQLLFDSID